MDQKVPLNAMEEWVLFNTSEEWHPFHIHVNDFQVVAINGEPYTAHSYDDTFLIPAHGSFTMRAAFSISPGSTSITATSCSTRITR